MFKIWCEMFDIRHLICEILNARFKIDDDVFNLWELIIEFSIWDWTYGATNQMHVILDLQLENCY